MPISNPGGAYGASGTSSARGAVTELYKLITAVSRGELVALSSTTGDLIRCLTNTAQRLVVGVAVEDIALGKTGLVCTLGPVFGVKKDTASAVTAGDLVTRATTDTASVAPLGQTTAVTQVKDSIGIVCGVVLADAVATATSCDVYVNKM